MSKTLATITTSIFSPVRYALLTLALSSFCQLANAATYYVATNGSDSNTGSTTAPFLTLQKAANTARAGDTVLVRNGTYGNAGVVTDGDSADTAKSAVVLYYSGTASAWITFKAENKGGAILDCQNLCDSYFNLLNASYVVIQDFVITRGYMEAIHSNDTAHHITIRGNRIEYIANRSTSLTKGMDGMYTNPNCHDFVIDGNVIHDIGRTSNNTTSLDHGLYLKGWNYTITNNVFYNFPRGWAIQMADGLSNVVVANNTFAFANSGQDGHIMFWDGQTNIKIQNNIFYSPRNYAIGRYTSSVSSCSIDHNIVYGASGMMSDTSGCSMGVSQVGVNPQLVNISTAPYDFHVQAGAPGIDAGVNLSAVTTDMYGNARPQGSAMDIGAAEYTSAVNPPVVSGVFSSGISYNSAFINWSTNVPATSYVDYGPTGYTATTPSNPTLVNQHSVTLSGLAPSTLYHFRVGSADSSGRLTVSADFTFVTAATPVQVVSSFAVSAALPSVATPQGLYVTDGITATLVSGSPISVSFSTSALPSGISASISPSSCVSTCSATLTLSSTSAAIPGTYNIVVTGAGGGISSSVNVALTVNMTVTTQGPAPKPVPDVLNGLAARWSFSEATSTNGSSSLASDSSGNGNTASLKGAQWASGTYGGAVSLSGSGYLTVNESPSLQITQNLTVSFWVNAAANSNTDPRVISKTYNWDVKLNGSNRYPQFSAGGNYGMLNYVLPLNQWQHITFTYSSKGVLKGYVNGVPATFATNTFSGKSSLPANAYGMTIGADTGPSNLYAGLIDEVRLYNRTLSDSEVSAIYAATIH